MLGLDHRGWPLAGTVCGVYSLASFFGIFLVQLPLLAVIVLGLLLLASPGRRLPARSLLLARAGLAAMLAETIVSMAWSALLPQLFARLDHGGPMLRTFGFASTIVGFAMAVLFAAGLGMLVAALLTARDPSAPPPPPPA
jgi:hypothetical protein